MFWVEPDNFVTADYEFETVSKLKICERCKVFIAFHKVIHTATPLTYLGYPSIHGCTITWCFYYAPCREPYYCEPYPKKL